MRYSLRRLFCLTTFVCAASGAAAIISEHFERVMQLVDSRPIHGGSDALTSCFATGFAGAMLFVCAALAAMCAVQIIDGRHREILPEDKRRRLSR